MVLVAGIAYQTATVHHYIGVTKLRVRAFQLVSCL